MLLFQRFGLCFRKSNVSLLGIIIKYTLLVYLTLITKYQSNKQGWCCFKTGILLLWKKCSVYMKYKEIQKMFALKQETVCDHYLSPISSLLKFRQYRHNQAEVIFISTSNRSTLRCFSLSQSNSSVIQHFPQRHVGMSSIPQAGHGGLHL